MNTYRLGCDVASDPFGLLQWRYLLHSWRPTLAMYRSMRRPRLERCRSPSQLLQLRVNEDVTNWQSPYITPNSFHSWRPTFAKYRLMYRPRLAYVARRLSNYESREVQNNIGFLCIQCTILKQRLLKRDPTRHDIRPEVLTA